MRDQETQATHPMYVLPENVYEEWAGCEGLTFQPNQRQQIVIEAVRTALGEGLYYTSQVHERCVELLRPSVEDLEVQKTKVEGGAVGMDFYYARGYIAAQNAFAAEREALGLLRPQVGMQLGTLMFNDFKRTTGVRIIEVMPDVLTLRLQGTRGSQTVQFTCGAVAVKSAMDRAAERDLRKGGFADYVSALSSPKARPAAPAVAVEGQFSLI
ncbi:MAG: hypothetical protein EKK53_22030 [Burkholderiales bacterium]|nr:MAG: hypothetical protein EKK53_22030 [Burkholderiales bacterium]